MNRRNYLLIILIIFILLISFLNSDKKYNSISINENKVKNHKFCLFIIPPQ